MGKILKYWTKEEMVEALKELPQNKPINKKTLKEYSKQKLICHPSTLTKYFGSIKNACKEANVRCDCVYDLVKKMNEVNTKWNKENIIEALKKLEKKYGKIKAIDIPMYSKKGECCTADTIRKHFKTIINAFKEAGIKHRNYYWSKARIIKALQNIYKQKGEFAKTDLRHKYIKEGLICERVHICKKFGSLNEAAKQAGIEFEYLENALVGKYEKAILDKVEMGKNIKLLRQFTTNGNYFIDGYDPVNNVAYEVDEEHHKWKQDEDRIREDQIKQELGCTFERIKVY